MTGVHKDFLPGLWTLDEIEECLWESPAFECEKLLPIAGGPFTIHLHTANTWNTEQDPPFRIHMFENGEFFLQRGYSGYKEKWNSFRQIMRQEMPKLLLGATKVNMTEWHQTGLKSCQLTQIKLEEQLRTTEAAISHLKEAGLAPKFILDTLKETREMLQQGINCNDESIEDHKTQLKKLLGDPAQE